jgi:hypothetical protein
MGGPAYHEQVGVAQPLAACLSQWNHDDFQHRFKALANGIGDRVRVTEHRLVHDHRPHGPPPDPFGPQAQQRPLRSDRATTSALRHTPCPGKYAQPRGTKCRPTPKQVNLSDKGAHLLVAKRAHL